MIKIDNFLEDRNQIVKHLPDDFTLYSEGDEDEQDFEVQIELDGHWLDVHGSIRAKRMYQRGATWDEPSEETDEYKVFATHGEVFNREGDHIKDLDQDELKLCAQTFKDLL